MSGPHLGRVEKEILRYFLRNPEAVDNCEGVARWRLLEETIYRNLLQTGQSLEALVVRGLLHETRRPGSAPIFSLNAENLAEARRLLEEEDSPDPTTPSSTT